MLICRGILRILHAKVSAALASWREQARKCKHKALLARGSMNRMLKRLISRAWEQWQQVAARVKVHARLVGGALKRMRNKKLSQAWEQWRRQAAEMRDQLELLRCGVMRMLQCQLAMGLVTWKEVAARMKVNTRLAGGALKRMRNMKMFQAWEQWRCQAAEMKEQSTMFQMMPPEKVVKLKVIMKNMVAKEDSSVRELASVVGKIMSMQVAVPAVRMMTAECYGLIRPEGDSDRTIILTNEVLNELLLVMDWVAHFNRFGNPIRRYVGMEEIRITLDAGTGYGWRIDGRVRSLDFTAPELAVAKDWAPGEKAE